MMDAAAAQVNAEAQPLLMEYASEFGPVGASRMISPHKPRAAPNDPDHDVGATHPLRPMLLQFLLMFPDTKPHTDNSKDRCN